MQRAQIVIRGGRPNPNDNDEVNTRGQEVRISVRDPETGVERALPCHGFVLRVDGRKAIATCSLEVDECDLVNIQIADQTSLQVKPR